jgi:hypothetical protein
VGLLDNTQHDFGDTICIDPKLHASEQFSTGDNGFYCGGSCMGVPPCGPKIGLSLEIPTGGGFLEFERRKFKQGITPGSDPKRVAASFGETGGLGQADNN